MKSSANSCCRSEAPTMSAEETKPQNGRIERENTDKEAMGGDDGTMKPQLPFSPLSSLAGPTRKTKPRTEEENTYNEVMGEDAEMIQPALNIFLKLMWLLYGILTLLWRYCMESLMNSSCCSEAPTMSAAETEPKNGIAEEDPDTETLRADDGMMKPELPFSQQSFVAEKGIQKKETGAVSAYPTIISNIEFVRHQAESASENACCSSGRTKQTLDHIMETLADPNTCMLGLDYSDEDTVKVVDPLLERVNRRAMRDNMFDVILKATVTKKSNTKKIQDEIAGGLGLKLDEKSVSKRASLLLDSIKMKQKILVVLCELYKGIDLGKLGIPFGADHSGCKILLTSRSEDVLSNQMHTQKNFSV